MVKSHKLWFDQNSFDNDVHFILFINNKVVGYVHLDLELIDFTMELKEVFVI